MTCTCQDERGNLLKECLGACRDKSKFIEQVMAVTEGYRIDKFKDLIEQNFFDVKSQLDRITITLSNLDNNGYREGFSDGFEKGFETALKLKDKILDEK